MASNDVIDLVENDDEPDQFSLSDNEKMKYAPSSLILRNIGLSVMKVQYGSQTNTPPLKLNKKQLWTNFWLDTPFYNFKYLADFKFNKTSKCPSNRSNYCNSNLKMTRLDYIHHVQKGHVRNRKKWRDIIRRKSNILEITCVICYRSKKELQVRDYINHMKKRHPSYPLLTDYHAFFKHCFICNTQTDTLQENVAHREICSKALFTTPHHEQTTAFNSCFQELPSKSLYYRLSTKYCQDDFYQRIKQAFQSKSLYGFCLSYNPKLRVEMPSHVLANGHNNRTSAVTLANNVNNNSSNPRNNQPSNSANMTTIRLQGPAQQSVRRPSTTTITTTTSTTPNTNNRVTHSNGGSTVVKESNKPLSFKEIKAKFCLGISSTFPQLRYSDLIDVQSNNQNSGTDKPVIYTNKFATPFYGGYDTKTQSPKDWSFNVVFCELCNAMTKGNINLYNHIRVTHPMARFFDNECKACLKKFYTPEGYRNHFSQPSDTCPVARKCIYCSQSIVIGSIYTHIFQQHKSEFEQVMEVPVCLICKYECSDIKELPGHLAMWHGLTDSLITNDHDRTHVSMETHESDLFNCDQCTSSFTNEVELRNHIITTRHYYECKAAGCNFVTDKAYFLHQHTAREHRKDQSQSQNTITNTTTNSSYSCELCPSTFSSGSLKISHFLKCHSMPCFVPLHYHKTNQK